MKKIFTTLMMAIVCLAFGMQAYAQDTPAATVYFKNTKNWAQPYAYAWGADGQPISEAWPGTQMTKNETTGLYEASFTAVPTNIIFNPGGDNGKTGDLAFVNGATYDGDGKRIDVSVTLTGVDLHGQITGNSKWESVKLTQNEETGNWEYTAEFNAGEFGINLYWSDSTNAQWVGGGATISEANHAYPFTSGGNSKFGLAAGKYTFVYNPTDKTVTFVPYEGEIEVIVTYALKGQIVNGNWDSFPMEKGTDNNLWAVALNVRAEGGEFGIQRLENLSQKNWIWGVDGNTIDKTGTYKAGVEGTDPGKNWVCKLNGGLYTFVFDPDNNTLEVKEGNTTGVEDILAEDGVREYYNLNGVKVAEENLTPGCYIVRCGNKVQKVFVR